MRPAMLLMSFARLTFRAFVCSGPFVASAPFAVSPAPPSESRTSAEVDGRERSSSGPSSTTSMSLSSTTLLAGCGDTGKTGDAASASAAAFAPTSFSDAAGLVLARSLTASGEAAAASASSSKASRRRAAKSAFRPAVERPLAFNSTRKSFTLKSLTCGKHGQTEAAIRRKRYGTITSDLLRVGPASVPCSCGAGSNLRFFRAAELCCKDSMML
eukprot:scaffold2129_cov255-Pinguiococcus_pyrenoidosus.AAC.1